MSVLFLFSTVIALIAITCIVRPQEFFEARQRLRVLFGAERSPRPLEPPPHTVFFDASHSWFELERSGTVRVGVGPVLIHLLGKPNRIRLRRPGSLVRPGEPLAELRRDERSLEVQASLEGQVIEVNARLLTRPSLIATDPYGDGWLVRLAPSALAQWLDQKKIADEARSWIGDELWSLEERAAELTGDPAPRRTKGPPPQGLSERLDDSTWHNLVDEVLGSGD